MATTSGKNVEIIADDALQAIYALEDELSRNSVHLDPSTKAKVELAVTELRGLIEREAGEK